MSDTPENIVWLNTDHYAYEHHRSLPGPYPSTPAFDRMREEGVCFENAHTPCPLCAPARGSLLTGEYPHQHGILNNTGAYDSEDRISTDAEFYSHALRDEGFEVGYFGKWHVGGNDTTAQEYGFDGWSLSGYGWPYGSDRYAQYLADRGLPEPTVDVEWDMKHDDTGPTDPTETGYLPVSASTGVFQTPKETHEAYFVTDLANRWIEEQAENGDPFFARVDVWGPHQPYWVPPEFADTIDPTDIPEYPNFDLDLSDRPAHHREFLDGKETSEYSWEELRPIVARCYEHVAAVERALDTVLETLDRLGLADDTLVVYSADHGDILGAHGGGFDKGWLMVEETMRVPLAMRWSDGLATGDRIDDLVLNMDVVPTIYDAAGLDIPANVQGESLLDADRTRDGRVDRDDLLCQHHGHYDREVFQRYLRHGDYKYVAHLDDTDELYDLEADPYERDNRIDDPELREVRGELRERLRSRMNELDDDSPNAIRLREALGNTERRG